MRRNATYHKTVRVLQSTAAFLIACNVLIWHAVLSDGRRAPEKPAAATEAPAQAVAADRFAGPSGDAAVAPGTDGAVEVGPPSAEPAAKPAGGAQRPAGSRTGATAGAVADEGDSDAGVGIPVRIMIPRIALDAAVERVGVASDGSMGVPRHPLDAAWYSLGPRPGEAGSATIAGHLDWINGSAAVFAELHKVKPGDAVAVRDARGNTVSFVVRETRRYDAAADAVDVFVSKDGKAHLNIITCDGSWDKGADQYTKRLVVFTDKQ